MRKRDKFLIIWLILVGLAPTAGELTRGVFVWNDPLNALFAVMVNVIAWYLILKLCFWIYDKLKNK